MNRRLAAVSYSAAELDVLDEALESFAAVRRYCHGLGGNTPEEAARLLADARTAEQLLARVGAERAENERVARRG